jgi:uncharacterized protein (UPF0332 family)
MSMYVIAEWQRAAHSLGAARVCLHGGFYADGVSRAYYAILHAAKAALQLRDVTAESHAAVKRLFGQHLVQPGLVEAEWGAMLGQSSDMRIIADYDVERPFTEVDAREACDRAEAFLDRMRTLLLAGGLTSEEIETHHG